MKFRKNTSRKKIKWGILLAGIVIFALITFFLTLQGKVFKAITITDLQQTVVITGQVPTNGLLGRYFQGITRSGTQVANRIDPVINFSAAPGTPTAQQFPPEVKSGQPLEVRNFSVIWTGQITATATGRYQFKTFSPFYDLLASGGGQSLSKDGVKLKIKRPDGTTQELINNNIDNIRTLTNSSTGQTDIFAEQNFGGITGRSGTTDFDMVAGQKFDITFEYYCETNLASIRLEWVPPGASAQAIPTSALSPPPITAPVTTGSSTTTTTTGTSGSTTTTTPSTTGTTSIADTLALLNSIASSNTGTPSPLSANSQATGGVASSAVLNVSLNRLSSTDVKFTIPQPGKLVIKAGPTSFLSGADIFALVLSRDKAAPVSATTPFTVASPHTALLNGINPDTPEELVFAIHFPEGRFRTTETTIAELPFTTTQEGRFEIKSIRFGNISSALPSQDFPVFIESTTIGYDSAGGARLAPTLPNVPTVPTPTTPACSDTLDNDADGKKDHPLDPGCSSATDTDETDPAPTGPQALRLDIPAQNIKVIQTTDGRSETFALLPPAQEQLLYQFTLKAAGGKGSNYSFGVRAKTPNINQAYPLTDSGLTLKASGLLLGDPGTLKSSKYRYPLFVTDGEQTLNFTLQMDVNKGDGTIGLTLETTSFPGTEHSCFVGKTCEAFFKADKGIPPYRYIFSGESPITGQFLQVNAGEAFYRFIPTSAQVGSYKASITVIDDSKLAGSDLPEGKASIPSFIIRIVEPPPPPVAPTPEVPSTFRFSAEKSCDFLDLSVIDREYDFFQFTCRNGIMEGFEGLIRAEDSLNRAEASKITTLIVSEEQKAVENFQPFTGLSPATPVNYQDVSVGDWYATFVYFLFKQGIIIDNKLYRPADTLNAAEAMKLVVESYAPLNTDLAKALLAQPVSKTWFIPYQTIASTVDASIAYVDPSLPAKREWIAELLFKLYRSYPVQKFK